MIGRFYFRLTTSGNLLGEFSNNLSNGNSTESADRVSGNLNDFQGTYLSSWQENGTVLFADLTISIKHAPNIFSLVWARNNKDIFWGEGFIIGDLLVGDYRDMPQVP